MVKNKQLICKKCSKRITKSHPNLKCSICDEVQHCSCNRLTKQEARNLIDSQIDWICTKCITDILPINACIVATKTQKDIDQFKVQCASCKGWSQSPSNIRTCLSCDGLVHVKCYKNYLGCISCCESIIPGYHCNYYELYNDYKKLNNVKYNPYDRNHCINLIGDVVNNEEHHNSMWNDVSEFLTHCQYKQQKHVQSSTSSQLKTFSMNIRSLIKNIDHLREEIATYSKYDVLLFNETNCVFELLPNGLDDIKLEGFHDPIVQNPIRPTGKGGGLVIYVHTRVVDYEKIELFNPNPEPLNTCGEFQFIKLHNCKGFNRTKIIGNIYRSPARKPDAFLELLTKILII